MKRMNEKNDPKALALKQDEDTVAPTRSAIGRGQPELTSKFLN